MRLYDPIAHIPNFPNFPRLRQVLQELDGLDLSGLPITDPTTGKKISRTTPYSYVKIALAEYLPLNTKFKVHRHPKVTHRGICYSKCVDFMVSFDGYWSYYLHGEKREEPEWINRWWVVIRGVKERPAIPAGFQFACAYTHSVLAGVFWREYVMRASSFIERKWDVFTEKQQKVIRAILDGETEQSICRRSGITPDHFSHFKDRIAKKIYAGIGKS